MQRLNGDNLRIAIQSNGRLTRSTLDLLHGIGLDFEAHERRLFTRCRNMEVELLFVRDDDIPEYVQDGVADLGVVGRNVVLEQGSRVVELEALGFGRCTLSIAVPRDAEVRSAAALEGKRIATTHPASLRRFLRERGVDASVIEIRGGAELAPALDIADAICDLVSTGTTLRVHDLVPVLALWESEAVMIGGREPRDDGDRESLVERLRTRIRGLLTARRLKYVTLNAPSSAVQRIRQILPGMKSPTIVPLADEGMVAVHAAVDEAAFWDAMERLKEAGASEILVLPVEKVLP